MNRARNTNNGSKTDPDARPLRGFLTSASAVEAIRTGRTLKQEVRWEFRTLASGPTLPLTRHGMIRLADALRWGDMAACQFAVGFKTVWGERRGPQLL